MFIKEFMALTMCDNSPKAGMHCTSDKLWMWTFVFGAMWHPRPWLKPYKNIVDKETTTFSISPDEH